MKRLIKASVLPGISDEMANQMLDEESIESYRNTIQDFNELGWSCKIVRGFYERGGGRLKYFTRLQITVPEEDYNTKDAQETTEETIQEICNRNKMIDGIFEYRPGTKYYIQKKGKDANGNIKLNVGG